MLECLARLLHEGARDQSRAHAAGLQPKPMPSSGAHSGIGRMWPEKFMKQQNLVDTLVGPYVPARGSRPDARAVRATYLRLQLYQLLLSMR
jgi:hypothetical protein